MRFMVIARRTETTDMAAFSERLAEEQRHTRALLESGRISDAYMARDGTSIFLIFDVLDEAELRRTLEEFPMRAILAWDTIELRP